MFDNDASISRGKDFQSDGKSLTEIFENLLESNPEILGQTCVIEHGTKLELTYEELNNRANILARVLIEKVKNGLSENRLKVKCETVFSKVLGKSIFLGRP